MRRVKNRVTVLMNSGSLVLRNLILETWGSLLDNDEPIKVNGKPWMVGEEKRAMNFWKPWN